MNCPSDGTKLLTIDQHGVGVDYCPTCHGVWLSQGELDRIIARSMPAEKPLQVTTRSKQATQSTRSSFLDDIFGF